MWWLLYEILFSKLALFGVLLCLVYYYGVQNYDYWKKKGVPYLKPKYPFFGNLLEVVLSIKANYIAQLETYKFFNGKPFAGVFIFTKPRLFVRDPSLIESIMIKDFTSFYNRGTGIDTDIEPLAANLVHLEDQKWKTLRQKLTPTFTSGKLKGMLPQFIDCTDVLINYLNGFVEKSEPIEAREVMAKLTTDVIGSCAFGLNTNAINDPNSEFRENGRKAFKLTLLIKLKLLIGLCYPRLQKIFKFKLRDQETENFFASLIKSTMSYREKNNITRNDFVQLLMELKKQDEEARKDFTEMDNDTLIIDDKIITANAFVFFAAGFETTASTLSYCLYELSIYQDIQEQAYQHVISVLKKHNGEITYDAIKDMTLLNQILSETLRMHPPLPELARVANADYVIPGTSILLPKGTPVIIPVYALHYDSEHFPEPEKFKPERFDKEKNTIKKGAYLPFGDGPRVCIGKRFAKMEMQVALVKILLKYKFTLNSKTISPLIYDPTSFFMVPVGGIWIDFHKRID